MCLSASPPTLFCHVSAVRCVYDRLLVNFMAGTAFAEKNNKSSSANAKWKKEEEQY